MPQTPEGALKLAAAKTGVSPEEYQRRRDAGEKWCFDCKAWQPQTAFSRDASRWDGLTASCTESRRRQHRAQYTPRPRPLPGRNIVPARDGDVKQARRRINFFVETGLLPHPNTLPCTDCGLVWIEGGRRHEYDHHLGYAAEHHEHVEVVCSTCHHIREDSRKP